MTPRSKKTEAEQALDAQHALVAKLRKGLDAAYREIVWSDFKHDAVSIRRAKRNLTNLKKELVAEEKVLDKLIRGGGSKRADRERSELGGKRK